MIDDDANKAVALNGHSAFNYSGLADLSGRRTDLWLSEVLAEVGNLTDQTVNVIAERATAAFSKVKLPAALKRHVFIGTGWTDRDQEPGIRPYACIISNALDDHLHWLPDARDSFSARVMFNGPLPWVWGFGQNVPRHLVTEFHRSVRNQTRRGLGPQAAIHTMARLVRNAAQRNAAIGRNLMAISLPRAGLNGQIATTLASDGRVKSDQASFLFIPHDNPDEFVTVAPNIVTGGSIMRSLKIGRDGFPYLPPMPSLARPGNPGLPLRDSL